jgi:hypothetical protein
LSARASWREERFAELYLPQTSAGSREISVLFADLEGFTSFSETHQPDEVARMLNDISPRQFPQWSPRTVAMLIASSATP